MNKLNGGVKVFLKPVPVVGFLKSFFIFADLFNKLKIVFGYVLDT